MTLAVYTAQISSADPDRFDVTRRSGGVDGRVFAPSGGLLDAAKSGRLTFGEYEPLYLAEMRVSYGVARERWGIAEHEANYERGVKPNRGAWDALLARPRVVLLCYCVDPDECHRSLLARILGKLGADVRGEVGLADALRAVGGAGVSGSITPRDVVTATDTAGAELCVVWTVLHRSGAIALSYDAAKARGLLAAVRKMRAARGAGEIGGGRS